MNDMMLLRLQWFYTNKVTNYKTELLTGTICAKHGGKLVFNKATEVINIL